MSALNSYTHRSAPGPAWACYRTQRQWGLLTPVGVSSSYFTGCPLDTILSLALNSAHPSWGILPYPHPKPSSLIFPDSWYSPLSFKGCGTILVSRYLGRSGHEFFTHCFWDCPSGPQLWDSFVVFKDLVSSARSSSSYTEMAKIPSHKFNNW